MKLVGLRTSPGSINGCESTKLDEIPHRYTSQGTSHTLLALKASPSPCRVYSLWFLCFSSSSEVFCDSQKKILKEADTIRFLRLADTYQKIANEGPDIFYNGSMARTIVQDIQDAGGQLLNCQNNIKLEIK